MKPITGIIEEDKAMAKDETRAQSRAVLVDHKVVKLDPRAADLRALKNQK